jgi:hypothetical protein
VPLQLLYTSNSPKHNPNKKILRKTLANHQWVLPPPATITSLIF